MSLLQTRQQIESAILEAIIYANGFPLVADILTPLNFRGQYHAEIFTAIKSLAPESVIDLITLLDHIEKIYPDRPEISSYLLANRAFTVVSNANIVYWAIILLQEDIALKFKKQLIDWKDLRDKSGDIVESAILEEVITSINDRSDIFDIITKSAEYFRLQNMQLEALEADAFEGHVSQKIKNIKRQQSVKLALDNVLTLVSPNTEIANACYKMASAMFDMIVNHSLPQNYIEATKHLE